MEEVKWSDLPKEIQDRMLECQEEQGNKRDSRVFKISITRDKNQGGFTWNRTSEGHVYWSGILNKYYDEEVSPIPEFTIEEAEKTFNIKIKKG
jgi:hypothetical protein